MSDLAAQSSPTTGPNSTSEKIFPHPWNPDGSGTVSTASLEGWVTGKLARHQEAIEGLLAVNGPRTFGNTLRRYDDAVSELSSAGSQTALLDSVYPDKAIRDAAQALLQMLLLVGRDLRDVAAALKGFADRRGQGGRASGRRPRPAGAHVSPGPPPWRSPQRPTWRCCR